MFAGLMLLMILTVKLFSEVPASRLLHRTLVEAPLRGLAVMSRRHLIYGAVVVAMLFAGTELIMMLGSTDLVMLMAWDVSLYVDAVIATWTIATVARGRTAWQMLAACLAGRRGTPRPRAPRRRRAGSKTAANDAGEDRGHWTYACAA
ncbi:MAG TPA: hypothetical protein VGO55_11435 [Allosphingosinicella sp.]|jgi:hypothetical protein|nr:hypothetical protein [Allosphingosinicella sp.]